MSTKITYNGKTTELADGYIATLPCKDLKMETDVVVEAPEPAESVGSSINVQPLNATANGTYDAPEGQAYDPVTVNVKPITEPITITENGVYPVPKGKGEVTEIITAESTPSVEDTMMGLGPLYRINCPIGDVDLSTVTVGQPMKIDDHYKITFTFNDGRSPVDIWLDNVEENELGLNLYFLELFPALSTADYQNTAVVCVPNNLAEMLTSIGQESMFDSVKDVFAPNSILIRLDVLTDENSAFASISVTYETEGGGKALDGWGDITVNIAPLPIEVSTEAEMTALLESGEVGGVYKYVGETTEAYENGALYVLENEGFNITLSGTVGGMGYFTTYIKLNSKPTSAEDYDYDAESLGSSGSVTVKASSIWYWGGHTETPYTEAVEIVCTEDSTHDFGYGGGGGSN